ncbi:hypothetical protein ACTVZO_30700 [Streptomyces sp. IBSNAI002]|uniref:hypothetical protein n=1 Tax=Streptomyces sp. IBSNAI002 TaxID=3457500 RepID=UPI003FD2A747
MDFTFNESDKDPGRDCFVYTAHSELDLLAIDTLREQAGTDLFGIAPATAAAPDPYRFHTTHMLVLVEGELVAGAELVAYSPLGLPLSEWPALDGVLRRSRRLVQVRRPFVRPGYADRALPELPFGAVGGLLKGCLQWAVSHDVGEVVAEVAAGRAASRLAELGFVPVAGARTAGPVRTRWIGVSELVARGFHPGNPFYSYLLASDESLLLGAPVSALA